MCLIIQLFHCEYFGNMDKMVPINVSFCPHLFFSKLFRSLESQTQIIHERGSQMHFLSTIINIDKVQGRSLKFIAYQEFKTLNNAIMITVEFAQRTRFTCEVNCYSALFKKQSTISG